MQFNRGSASHSSSALARMRCSFVSKSGRPYICPWSKVIDGLGYIGRGSLVIDGSLYLPAKFWPADASMELERLKSSSLFQCPIPVSLPAFPYCRR